MSDFTLYQVRLVNVSCFLLYGKGGVMLVDCGNKGSEKAIFEAMVKLGLDPGSLSLLVLTHAHFDHAGSAAKIREITGCRIMVHRAEAERLRSGFTRIPDGTRWKARILVGVGRIFARRLGKYPPASPDIEITAETDLAEYGFPARLIPAPGHTPGSMVVFLQSGELLGGDTFFGLEGKQHFPPFAEDLPALVDTWKRLRDLAMNTIYPAHGKPFSRESFLKEFDGAMQRYGG